MRVFLSYSGGDRVDALELHDAIQRVRPNWRLFFDKKRIVGGAYWMATLDREMVQSEAVLLLLGDRVGPWQEIEYLAARDLQVSSPGQRPRIVPVVKADSIPGLPFLNQLHLLLTPRPLDRLADIVRALEEGGVAGEPPWTLMNPYKGLPALNSSDAGFFFGREHETARLIAALAEAPDRAHVLVGASGVGKSSLAQAGLISAMHAQRMPEGIRAHWPSALAKSREWLALTLRPSEKPIDTLVGTLVRLFEAETHKVQAAIRGWKATLEAGDRLDDLLAETRAQIGLRLGAPPPAGFLLYVDQSEEMFTSASPMERALFMRLLAEAAEHPLCHVVLSLRVDHYGAFLASGQLFERSVRHDLAPLGEAGLLRAIMAPAKQLGVGFEKDLAAGLVAKALGRDGALPLLADLLDTMWKAMRERTVQPGPRGPCLTWSDARGLDLAGPLRERAQALIDRDPAREVALRRMLTLQMTRLSRATPPVRRALPQQEADAATWELATQLADPEVRLVTLAETPQGVVAELAHEALFEGWPKLASWIEEEREFLVLRDRIEEDRMTWASQPEGERAGELLRGLDLARARDALVAREADLGPDNAAFIRASIDQDAEDRVQRRVQDARIAMARGDARSALWQMRRAVSSPLATAQERTILPNLVRMIVEPRRLPATTDSVLGSAPTKEIFALATTPDGAWVLHCAGSGRIQIRHLGQDASLDLALEFQAHAVNEDITSITFCHDAKVFATVGRNDKREGTVAVWEWPEPGEAPRERWRSEQVMQLGWDAALDADGDFVVYGSGERPVLGGPAPYGVASPLEKLGSRLVGLEILSSADPVQPAQRLLGTGIGGHAAVWDLKTGERLWSEQIAHEDLLWVGQMPTSRQVAITTSSGQVLVFLVTKDGKLAGRKLFVGHTRHANDCAFSEDFGLLASASADGSVAIWTPEGDGTSELGSPVHTIRVDDPCWSVAFNPKGPHLLIGTARRGIERFQLPMAHRTLRVPDGAAVLTVDVARDGGLLAAGTFDGQLVLWDQRQGWRTLRDKGTPVTACRLDEDARKLLVADDSGWIALFDLTATEPAEIASHQFHTSVPDLLWRADNSAVLVAGLDGTLGVLDPNTLKLRKRIHVASAVDPKGGLVRLAQDRHTGAVVAACWQRGVVYWPDGVSLEGTPRHILDEPCSAVAIQPGTGNILAGGMDGRLRFIRPDGAVDLWPDRHGLRGGTTKKTVQSVAFTPDGRLALSTANGVTVRIWDTASGRRIARLRGHADWLTQLRIQADGFGLATASWDGTVRLWSLPFGEDCIVEMAARLGKMDLGPAFSPLFDSIASDGYVHGQ